MICTINTAFKNDYVPKMNLCLQILLQLSPYGKTRHMQLMSWFLIHLQEKRDCHQSYTICPHQSTAEFETTKPISFQMKPTMHSTSFKLVLSDGLNSSNWKWIHHFLRNCMPFFKEYTKESTAITETDARLMWVWKCMENEEVKNNRYLNDTLLNLFLT